MKKIVNTIKSEANVFIFYSFLFGMALFVVCLCVALDYPEAAAMRLRQLWATVSFFGLMFAIGAPVYIILLTQSTK